MRKKTKQLFGVLISVGFIIALCVAPLILLRESEFVGADALAEELTYEIAPDYQPWTQSWWAPPGGETESLLFSLQAAIGSGVFCFFAGYLLAAKKYTLRNPNSAAVLSTAAQQPVSHRGTTSRALCAGIALGAIRLSALPQVVRCHTLPNQNSASVLSATARRSVLRPVSRRMAASRTRYAGLNAMSNATKQENRAHDDA